MRILIQRFFWTIDATLRQWCARIRGRNLPTITEYPIPGNDAEVLLERSLNRVRAECYSCGRTFVSVTPDNVLDYCGYFENDDEFYRALGEPPLPPLSAEECWSKLLQLLGPRMPDGLTSASHRQDLTRPFEESTRIATVRVWIASPREIRFDVWIRPGLKSDCFFAIPGAVVVCSEEPTGSPEPSASSASP